MAGTVRVARVSLRTGPAAPTATVRVSRVSLLSGPAPRVGTVRVSRVSLLSGPVTTPAVGRVRVSRVALLAPAAAAAPNYQFYRWDIPTQALVAVSLAYGPAVTYLTP